MEVRKLGGLEVWFCWWGSAPHPDFLSHGAKRRAAGAVSGEAVERPMEPEAVRAFPRVFAVPISSGHDCFPGSVTKPRGRTNRTYRTYRTAADAALHNDFARRSQGRSCISCAACWAAAHPSRACRAFCSLFSVLRSLFSVLRSPFSNKTRAAQVGGPCFIL